MPYFFKTVLYKKNKKEWANFLDWLFDDKKFDKWESNNKNHLTRQINKNCTELNIKIQEKVKEGTFPQKSICEGIYLSGEKSSERIIKHIRNGIAHCHIEFKKHKKENWILIRDYYTQDIKNKGKLLHKNGDTSAYIFVSEVFLMNIYIMFMDEKGN